jgi:hypothetical protein
MSDRDLEKPVAPYSLEDLQRRLSGYVLRPADSGYSAVVDIDNGRIDQRPRFVVMANGTADVATSLRFAQEHGIPFTVRGGGHSAAGYCLNSSGMVLDLSLMRAIRLNEKNRHVHVQMGALWNDVYLFLMATGTGLIPIGGGCPTVGIPGFMQGGGYSFVSRSYGLSVDNLLELTIVTADGEVRRISESSNTKEERDLFWACRGGGGGNFGVVVEMEILVHQPNTPQMFTGQYRYHVDQAQEVLGFYNQWVESLPNEMAVYGIWGTQPDPADSTKIIKTFGFTAIFNGDFAEGAALAEPLLGFNPLTVQMTRFTLPEFEIVNGRTTLVDRRNAYIRSGMMAPRAFDSTVVEIMKNYMDAAPSPSTFMVWTHAGGKISDYPADSTSFAHRGARFVPEVKAIWDGNLATRTNVEWAYHFYRDLRPHFIGAYVNYIDPLLPHWAAEYYGDHYTRLVEVKRYWDPQNFFHFQQGVGSPFEPSPSEPLDLSPLNRTFV